jgi:predicted nucleic acid-binding protein
MLLGDEHRERAAVLTGWGLKTVDALHVACAEALRADVLLTTDDRLSAAANRPGTGLQVRVANPLSWLEENV